MSEQVKIGISCPTCGEFILIRGTAEPYKYKPRPDIEKDVKAIIPSRNVKIQIQGSHALIELTEKFNPKTFKKISQEVRGYGGRYIKGHFILPLAGLGEDK